MKKVLSLFLLLQVTSAFAVSEQTYKISGKFYSFEEVDGLLISKDCKKNCMALTKTKSLSPFKLNKNKVGNFASAISSYACKHQMSGYPLLGIDSDKNMKSFCYFKNDQSMIEMNSLEKVAQKKLVK